MAPLLTMYYLRRDISRWFLNFEMNTIVLFLSQGLSGNIQGFPKRASWYTAQRDGNGSRLIYEEPRGVLKVSLENGIRDADPYTEFGTTKTVVTAI